MRIHANWDWWIWREREKRGERREEREEREEREREREGEGSFDREAFCNTVASATEIEQKERKVEIDR